jgi:hypothetical protein
MHNVLHAQLSGVPKQPAKFISLSSESQMSHPERLIGRSIEKKFRSAWHVGRVIGHDTDEATNQQIWRVRYSDGDEGDYNAAELERIIIDEDDQLQLAERRLERPDLLLGSKFFWPYGGRLYSGIIIDHDEDAATGEAIWGVLFDDGDRADFNLADISRGILYNRIEKDTAILINRTKSV